MSLASKVAIITGASSGIGAETAVVFSKHGASLVLTGRNEDGLDKTIKQCDLSHKNEIIKVAGAIEDTNTLKNIVNTAIEKFKRIDILVNNAGMVHYGSIENLKIEEYDQVMNVNLRSTILLTQLCVPHLIESKGSVVNVSSICGTKSYPNFLAYGISKAGMDQFTKTISLELAPKGVRVNSVNPGTILTPILERNGIIGKDEEKDKIFLESRRKLHPLGRLGASDDVAQAILFLASQNSSFITGELLHIDGGRHNFNY